jgi:gas vesicle protein
MGELANVILAKQQLKESKRQADQQLALQLLSLDIAEDRFNLQMESNLLDKQLIRAEKKYDAVFEELEVSKQDFQDLTGQIYKVPEQNKSHGSIDVVNDIGGSIVDSLNQILEDTQRDTQSLKESKVDINTQLREAKLLADFYTGVGHDPSAGDPDQWDMEDFSDEELTKYMKQYPELDDVDKKSFFEGMKTRGTANLLQNMTVLNTALNQAKTAKLNADIKQLDFDMKQENMPTSQIEHDISTIDKGVHSMLQSQANVLNSNLLAPAIQASIEFSTSQTPSDPEGDPGLEKAKEDQLIFIGSQISGLPSDSENEEVRNENLRLGKTLVLGNVNYVNSIKGHLAGTGDLDYVGYTNALQEIQMYGENARRQMEAGQITTDEYLVYKNQLERITGKNLNEFSSEMDLVMQASDQVENKGKLLALSGMKDQYQVYEPSVDYDVPEDYMSVEAAEAAATQKAMSNIVLPDGNIILPDSSTVLPDSSAILLDEDKDFSLEQFFESDDKAPSSRGRGAQLDPKYAGLLSKGEPYFDEESGKWLYEEPMFNLAGGFLPVPNPSAFRDKPVAGQYMHEDDKIQPVLDKKGKIVGFIPPTNYAPPSTTLVAPVLFETLTKEQIELVIKQLKEQGNQ